MIREKKDGTMFMIKFLAGLFFGIVFGAVILIVVIVVLNTYISKKCERVIKRDYAVQIQSLEKRVEELELKNLMTGNLPDPILIYDGKNTDIQLQLQLQKDEKKPSSVQKP